MQPLLSVIIPAHNEEQRLPNSLGQVLSFLAAQSYPSEILVVENASRDRTADIVRKLIPQHANLRLLQEPRAGKGLAVRRGMSEAAGEFRFICDADLSMPIEQINRFLPPHLTNFDIAIGSREIPGAVRYQEPWYRHLMGRVFNLAVRLLAVPGIQDTQAGFKCFRSQAANDLFSIQLLEGWSFDVEVLFLARKRGYRIVEVPISWYFNSHSQIRPLQDSMVMFTDLLRLRLNWQRGVYGKSG